MTRSPHHATARLEHRGAVGCATLYPLNGDDEVDVTRDDIEQALFRSIQGVAVFLIHTKNGPHARWCVSILSAAAALEEFSYV